MTTAMRRFVISGIAAEGFARAGSPHWNAIHSLTHIFPNTGLMYAASTSQNILLIAPMARRNLQS